MMVTVSTQLIEELVTACKAARLFLSDQDARDDMSDVGYVHYDSVVDALDAAIAKAEGEH